MSMEYLFEEDEEGCYLVDYEEYEECEYKKTKVIEGKTYYYCCAFPEDDIEPEEFFDDDDEFLDDFEEDFLEEEP